MQCSHLPTAIASPLRSRCPSWPARMLALMLTLVLGWLLPLLAAAAPLPPAPLVLDDGTAVIEAWPAVTVLPEDDRPIDIREAIASASRFTVPQTAYGTLGMHKQPVWIRVPVSVPASADGRWILDIDYAVLNRVELHVVRDGQVLQRVVLGNLEPFAERPLASRTPATPLEFTPGADYELFMRVHTLGGMVVPITLNKPAAFHARALNEHLLQGLFTGLGVWLLLYSLLQWLTLRDSLYIKYAMLISGSIAFSIFQFGLGQQYLWTDNDWLELHAGGLSALIASAGTFLFVEQALARPSTSRLFSRVMVLGAATLLLFALLYAADLVHVHTISIVIGTLGLLPALMGLPGAIARARRGDSVGWYFLFAWMGYFVSTWLMVRMIKGGIDVNFWTLHSFQIGATLDMLLFMRVLSLRSAELHAQAQHATREREVLLSQALTDPLTGLPNRRGLTAALDAALPQCSNESLLAVYMLDLDGFKQVNDQYGHDVGDELLMQVAQRLRANVRTADVVARLGGDEFVVTIGGLKSDRKAHELGAQLVTAFRQPFDVGGRICHVGLTIGYVLVPVDGDDPAVLLKGADAAMYAGKQGGKNCLRRGEPVATVVGAL